LPSGDRFHRIATQEDSCFHGLIRATLATGERADMLDSAEGRAQRSHHRAAARERDMVASRTRMAIITTAAYGPWRRTRVRRLALGRRSARSRLAIIETGSRPSPISIR